MWEVIAEMERARLQVDDAQARQFEGIARRMDVMLNKYLELLRWKGL